MKKIILILVVILSIGLNAQPEKPEKHGKRCGHRGRCNCPSNPAPLDDYLPVLFIAGGLLYWKLQKRKEVII